MYGGSFGIFLASRSAKAKEFSCRRSFSVITDIERAEISLCVSQRFIIIAYDIVHRGEWLWSSANDKGLQTKISKFILEGPRFSHFLFSDNHPRTFTLTLIGHCRLISFPSQFPADAVHPNLRSWQGTTTSEWTHGKNIPESSAATKLLALRQLSCLLEHTATDIKCGGFSKRDCAN